VTRTPVRFALLNGDTGDEAVTGWLLPHEDPQNPGHYVATSRLPSGSSLPVNCGVRLVARQPQASDADEAALREAISSVAGEGDRAAWQAWLEDECDAGRLPARFRQLVK
jgi:hypothetical protein